MPYNYWTSLKEAIKPGENVRSCKGVETQRYNGMVASISIFHGKVGTKYDQKQDHKLDQCLTK